MTDSDDLREALEWYDSKARWRVRGDTSSGGAAIETFVAAARRFLALAETGPDYEAAAKLMWEMWRDENNMGGCWEDVRSLARSHWIAEARAIVDAAVPWLSDYTEEE